MHFSSVLHSYKSFVYSSVVNICINIDATRKLMCNILSILKSENINIIFVSRPWAGRFLVSKSVESNKACSMN